MQAGGHGFESRQLHILQPHVLAALARVEALGGGALRDFVEPGGNVAVVADPDGDEFCLVRG